MHSTLETINWREIEPLKRLSFHGSIFIDSRQVQSGDLFFAYRGNHTDGRNFIPQAITKGVVAVVYEDTPDFKPINYGVPMYPVKNLPRLAGVIAAILLKNSPCPIKVLGVTGTNGKTSISQWLAQALDLLDEKSAIIGTNGYGFWGALEQASHTTPDALCIQNLLQSFIAQRAGFLAMEVSSHGIHQARINGVEFDTAVFTNLTRDHLDYHRSFENYFEVKKQLFYWKQLRHAMINLDDTYGERLITELKQHNPDLMVTSYGFSEKADVHIAASKYSLEGMQLTLNSLFGTVQINSSLLGAFNALNLAAVFGVLCGLGFSSDKVAQVLTQVQAAKGRMQTIRVGDRPIVVVDYAHTPDALQNVLQALKACQSKTGKIWCVFGCGGDRDIGKRPLMGKIVNQYANYSVVTSDNPRNEDPEAIIRQILPVDNAVLIEPDREKAIAYAIKRAAPNDIVLIAGKGHENYQEISGTRHHFDDLEVAKQYLEID